MNDGGHSTTYLSERGMLVDYKVIGEREFELFRIVGKPDEIRRFIKSRQ